MMPLWTGVTLRAKRAGYRSYRRPRPATRLKPTRAYRELRATSYELRATSYELRATSYELRATQKVFAFVYTHKKYTIFDIISIRLHTFESSYQVLLFVVISRFSIKFISAITVIIPVLPEITSLLLGHFAFHIFHIIETETNFRSFFKFAGLLYAPL